MEIKNTFQGLYYYVDFEDNYLYCSCPNIVEAYFDTEIDENGDLIVTYAYK